MRTFLGHTQSVLPSLRVVDLTATLGPDTVMWPGEQPVSTVVTETIERDGSFGRRVSVGEHTGTHFDAPIHFAADGASVAEVPAEQLVAPLRVIDIAGESAAEPDAVLTLTQVAAHEQRCGRIESGSAVFLRTGWDRYRQDARDYLGAGDQLHFPGFGVEAARFLVEQRKVVGLGIDTASVDPGASTDFAIHGEVTLPNGVWNVENAVNLDAVPEVGAWVVVGVPKLADASGFPARVLALVPTS